MNKTIHITNVNVRLLDEQRIHLAKLIDKSESCLESPKYYYLINSAQGILNMLDEWSDKVYLDNKNKMVLVHRAQRAEARYIAITKYPDEPYKATWGEGIDLEHTYNRYKHHPKYQQEYIKQLKLIRSKRYINRCR